MSLERNPDIVTIRFVDDRITGFSIIGSGAPCEKFLEVGARVGTALRCLLRNGFRVITLRSNVVVLRRSSSETGR
jgi:hypothetical protein